MSKVKFDLRKAVTIVICLAGITMFSGCSKDNDPDIILLKVSEKTLYHDDEYKIEATSKADITYLSENEYNAKVSENGLITAMFVGETNILLSNGEDAKKFKVIVAPKSNLYPEPDVKFGDTRSSIIAKFGTPDSENTTGIGYANYSNSAPILMFLFDASNKMKSYVIMVKSAYSSTLADFLLERYMAVAEKDGLFMFINGLNVNTATMAIGLSLYNVSYWQVMYIPNTTDKSAQLRSSKSSSDMSGFNELLKQLQ